MPGQQSVSRISLDLTINLLDHAARLYNDIPASLPSELDGITRVTNAKCLGSDERLFGQSLDKTEMLEGFTSDGTSGINLLFDHMIWSRDQPKARPESLFVL